MRKIYAFFSKKYKPLLFIMIFGLAALCGYSQPCTLTANTVGYNAAYIQIYVLTDNMGIILDQNTTGIFNVNLAGTYYIHALNYDPLSPPNPLPSVSIGLPISDIGSIAQGCYNSDFLTDNVQRVCGCQSFCVGSSVIITTSGYNATYSQVYVLTDSLGTILAVNPSGDFTADVSPGHTYNVYALNYNPSNPPIPFPIAGGIISAVGGTSAGCMNGDFLTDVHCITIDACTTCQQQHDILQGDTYTSNCTGWAAGAYTQLYFLVDSMGVIEDLNTTGVFTYNFPVGSNHKVYALNYSLSNPPIPIPAIGGDILSLGSTFLGCYNEDFLNDFVCMKVIGFMVLSNNELSLLGRQTGNFNILDWKVNTSIGSDYFDLERSENGQQFQKLTSKNGILATNTTEYYTYTDTFPLLNRNYYRVRQTDIEGNVYFSNTVLLQHSVEISTQVFPNPFKDMLSMVIEGGTGNASLYLYNDLGQTLIHTIWTLDKPIEEYSVSTAKLADGVYYYKIIVEGQTIRGKIVKN